MKPPPCASRFSRPDAATPRKSSGFVKWIRFGPAGLAALLFSSTALADIPAGTVLEVRLLTSLSSYRSKPGAEVQAFVVAPGCPDGLPAGTVIRGNVKRVSKVGLGLIHESASLDLEFTDLRLPDGQTYPLRARLTGVDNAREHVNRRGSIRGIRATASLSNRMASKILFAVDDHPLFLLPMLAVETLPKSEARSKRYGPSDGRLILIRPDGYIGFKCAADEADVLEGALESLLSL